MAFAMKLDLEVKVWSKCLGLVNLADEGWQPMADSHRIEPPENAADQVSKSRR